MLKKLSRQSILLHQAINNFLFFIKLFFAIFLKGLFFLLLEYIFLPKCRSNQQVQAIILEPEKSLWLVFPIEGDTLQIRDYEEGATVPCLKYITMNNKSHVICDEIYEIILQ